VRRGRTRQREPSSKKTVVEHCRFLDASRWMREGILKGGVWQSGSSAGIATPV
jgi:hypothetical protein